MASIQISTKSMELRFHRRSNYSIRAEIRGVDCKAVAVGFRGNRSFRLRRLPCTKANSSDPTMEKSEIGKCVRATGCDRISPGTPSHGKRTQFASPRGGPWQSRSLKDPPEERRGSSQIAATPLVLGVRVKGGLLRTGAKALTPQHI